jgi:hypothetical protein
MIRWMNENANDSDSIVEAPGCSYGLLGGVPLSRISAFTGLPTLIGWQGHEYQWRRGDAEATALLATRVDTANALLSGMPASVQGAAGPRFLVFGSQERTLSPGCSSSVERDDSTLAALAAAGWVEAFQSGNDRIFVRTGDPLADETPSGFGATVNSPR